MAMYQALLYTFCASCIIVYFSVIHNVMGGMCTDELITTSGMGFGHPAKYYSYVIQ